MNLRKKKIIGLLFASSVFAGLLFLSGPLNLINAFQKLNFVVYFVSAGFILISFSLRGYIWFLLFKAGKIHTNFLNILSVYFAAFGIRLLLPIGQIAIQPILAYSISKNNYFKAERVFTIISVGDTFNFIPYYTIGVIGFSFVLFERVVIDNFWLYFGIILSSGILLSSIIIIIWKYEHIFLWSVQKSVSPIRFLNSFLDVEWLEHLFSRESIEQRIDIFYSWLDQLFDNKKEVIVLFVLSHIGVVFAVFGLILVGYSLQVEIGFFTASIIVSVSRLGGLLPSPGGSGGIEAIIISLGFALTSASLSTWAMIALLYRFLTYWMILGIGLSLGSNLTKQFDTIEKS